MIIFVITFSDSIAYVTQFLAYEVIQWTFKLE